MINSQMINRWCFWELSREESFKQIWSVVVATNQITFRLGWLLCLFLVRYERECVVTPDMTPLVVQKNDSTQSNLVNNWICKCSSQEYRWVAVYTVICDWKAAPVGKRQPYLAWGKTHESCIPGSSHCTTSRPFYWWASLFYPEVSVCNIGNSLANNV